MTTNFIPQTYPLWTLILSNDGELEAVLIIAWRVDQVGILPVVTDGHHEPEALPATRWSGFYPDCTTAQAEKDKIEGEEYR
jgi:hypothetical protein